MKNTNIEEDSTEDAMEIHIGPKVICDEAKSVTSTINLILFKCSEKV